MLRGWKVPNEIDVGRPREICRILRAADQEAELRPLPRRAHKQIFEGLLPILRIGTEIGKAGAIVRLRGSGPIDIRIGMPVEWFDSPGSEQTLEFAEHQRPAGKAQYQIEILQALGADIRHSFTVPKACQRDRRIE